MADDTAPSVTRDEHQSRYEISVGGVLAGFTQFETDDRGRTAYSHTEVDPAFRGQGLAGILMREAMADEAARGATVVPYCSSVARYLREHPVDGLTVEWPHPLPGTRG